MFSYNFFRLLFIKTELSGASSLLFLPDQARRHLADMGDYLDQELAKSQQNSIIEMQWARQAHYIEWCNVHKIPDPCGYELGYEHMVAIYIKCVIDGINYHNKDMVRSKTACGYADTVNLLFQLRGFALQANFDDAANKMAIIVEKLYKEKKIASQRSPLDN